MTNGVAQPDIVHLDAWFKSLLSADGSPRSQLALFWHEVVHPEDGPVVEPITRGLHMLQYHELHRPIGDVPGQAGLPKRRRPEPRSRAILWANAGRSDSLCKLTFRYELDDASQLPDERALQSSLASSNTPVPEFEDD